MSALILFLEVLSCHFYLFVPGFFISEVSMENTVYFQRVVKNNPRKAGKGFDLASRVLVRRHFVGNVPVW